MKILESGENYLETILRLSKKNGTVRSVDIANDMGFSKASVSVAMKQFRENGFITVEGGLISLTSKGQEIALRVLERHNLLSSFLVLLGVSGEQALEDACKMEHDISDESFEAIKRWVNLASDPERQ